MPVDLQLQIEKSLITNDFKSALDRLKQEEMPFHQKDDVLALAQVFDQIQNDEAIGLDTKENIRIRKLSLSKSILAITKKMMDGEPEEATTNKGWLSQIITKYLPFGKTKPKNTKNNLLAEEAENITQSLITRYESRLTQKTANRLPVNLSFTFTKEGTSQQYQHWNPELEKFYNDKIRVSPKSTLLAITKRFKHLLIIGKPGAGKSTQLLELGVSWLKDKDCAQIPVVFNLAPWKATDKHFHEWLEGALVSGYGFSKALAKEAIANNQILPLLDGLDEVGTKEAKEAEKTALRSHCLQAVDRYLSLFDVPYLVICSRIDEYANASDAPIKAEVLINPLTSTQIKETLSTALEQKIKNNDENAANNLLKLFDQHPTLEKVLCTPFYYNIALDVFDERTTIHDLPTEEKALGRYLVEQYLAKKLATTKNKSAYIEKETKHYLSFVANVLEVENNKNFELVSFQPWHLRKKWRMSLLLGLVVGLIMNLVVILLLGVEVILGLMLGSVLGWAGSYISILNINPKEIRGITWLKLFEFSIWIESLIMGIIISLCIGLIGNFVLGFFIGFMGNLVNGLFNIHTFNNIKNPYYKLKHEALFKISQWTLILPLSIIFAKNVQEGFETLNDLYYWIIFSLLMGVISGFLITAFFNHFILRLCLKWEKRLPLRWVSFFRYATNARILEQDGGQWRFRHQILQDYFLEKWEEQECRIKNDK